MEISPYLNFDGRCAEAFKFYERCLGGTIVMMQTHGESPMKDQVPAEWRDKILHARMVVDGKALMGSDAPTEHFNKPAGFAVSISVPDPTAGERVFNELAAHGNVSMPFQKTFWSPGFGMCVDRFGIPWMVNCEPVV